MDEMFSKTRNAVAFAIGFLVVIIAFSLMFPVGQRGPASYSGDHYLDYNPLGDPSA